jgi:hypothetical protein|tara:strand:- start:171 stop:518 length:348 start_codon:yes stop_codon:yes gene_type:complete
MEKFLSIPVLDANGTNSQNQLVSIVDIKIIKQTTTTAVRIDYVDGKQTTLTYPVAKASPILLNEVESVVKDALVKGWTDVVTPYNPNGFVIGSQVSGGDTGSLDSTNPLASIAIA